MVDYESNAINPVKSLDTIAGLAPSRAREERKRRQQYHQDQEPEQEPEQDQEQSAEDSEPLPEKQPKSKDNKNTDGIDYCA